MTSRYPTAVEREAAKRAGIEPSHPADKHEDPLAAQISESTEEPQKRARLKEVGGSDHESFNIGLANAVLDTAWFTTGEERSKQVGMISRELAAIAPRDELEAMLAGQMVAAHQASLECYRRAMIDGQTVEGRAMNLKHGTKASATFAALLDTLNRHRGRAPQRVIVEHRHLHYHESGKGPGEPGADGAGIENQDQPYENRAIAHAHEPPLQRQDEEREPVPVPSDGERTLPASRRTEPRRTKRTG